MKLKYLTISLITATFAWVSSAIAHDTWVQTIQSIVRSNDVVHIDFCLGNHGNDHRDFKFASKLSSLEGAKVDVIAPSGKSTDICSSMTDLGYAPKEGFYSTRYVPVEEGLYCIAHKLDLLHGTTRAIKSSKAYFFASKSLDKVTSEAGDHSKPLGHALEFVLDTHPVLRTGPAQEIKVQLVHHGKPVANQRVSFIPRGITLSEEFDSTYERMTDPEGRASFTPKEGNLILVVAHLPAPSEAGDGYEKTHYGATLVLNIPERCVCCDE